MNELMMEIVLEQLFGTAEQVEPRGEIKYIPMVVEKNGVVTEELLEVEIL